ncbi:MAG: hypothetical protein DWC07_07840 [Candidatus Poseidoniales archaeon]|nr:MAG: hypothetical protein DWC07_07840 [Candidatus Poseidoniales archaeon]
MVVFNCPHCSEGVEVDDEEKGHFGCPHCEAEFEWNGEQRRSSIGQQLLAGCSPPLFFLLLAIVVQESEDMVFLLHGLSFGSALYMIAKGYKNGNAWTWKPLLYTLIFGPPLLLAYAVLIRDACIGFCIY